VAAGDVGGRRALLVDRSSNRGADRGGNRFHHRRGIPVACCTASICSVISWGPRGLHRQLLHLAGNHRKRHCRVNQSRNNFGSFLCEVLLFSLVGSAQTRWRRKNIAKNSYAAG
jgi:hypothetical protein